MSGAVELDLPRGDHLLEGPTPCDPFTILEPLAQEHIWRQVDQIDQTNLGARVELIHGVDVLCQVRAAGLVDATGIDPHVGDGGHALLGEPAGGQDLGVPRLLSRAVGAIRGGDVHLLVGDLLVAPCVREDYIGRDWIDVFFQVEGLGVDEVHLGAGLWAGRDLGRRERGKMEHEVGNYHACVLVCLH